MPVHLNPTAADNIPEEFTLDSLNASLTEDEMAALMGGDDPIMGNTAAADAEAAAALAAEQAAAAAATAQADAAAKAAADAAQAQPKVQIPDTTAAEQTIAKIDDDLAALATKYDAGDLTQAEWLAQQKVLIQQQAQAQVQIEQAQQVITNHVEQRRQAFYSTLETYKVENALLWSPEHLQGWDAALKAVTGNQAYRDLSAARQIELAHDMYAANVKAITGNSIAGPKTATPKPAEEEGGPRKDARPDPVQTLGGFNTDANASIEDGTFAAIDKMTEKDPLAAEQMLARLPADVQKEYLERA